MGEPRPGREAQAGDLFERGALLVGEARVHVAATGLDRIDDLIEHIVEQSEGVGLDREHVRHRDVAAVDERHRAVPHVERVLVAGHRLVGAAAATRDVAVWPVLAAGLAVLVAVHLLGQHSRVLRRRRAGAEPGDVGRAHHHRGPHVRLDQVSAEVERELDGVVAEPCQLAGHGDVLLPGDVHERLDEPTVVLLGGREVHREPQVGFGEPAVDVPVPHGQVAPLVDVDERLGEQRVRIQFVARHESPECVADQTTDPVDGTPLLRCESACYTTYIQRSSDDQILVDAGSTFVRAGIGYRRRMSDEQDVSESVDEEMVGTDAVTSDEVGSFGDAPDRPVGLPFADADVTDESLADRVDREVPEVLDDPDEPLRLVEPAVLVDSDLLDEVDDDGDLAEAD